MPDALKNLLDRLGVEVSFGHHHASIGKTLEDRLTAVHWDTAFEFWMFTLKAHFEVAVIGLTRLLDRRRNTVSLERLPSLAGSKAGQFDEMNAEEVRRQLVPSINREVEELKRMAEPLKKRRDETLAHSVLQGTLSDPEWNVAWADLEAAYSRVRELVNRVYKAYKGRDAILIVGARQTTISAELTKVLTERPQAGIFAKEA